MIVSKAFRTCNSVLVSFGALVIWWQKLFPIH